MGTRRRQLGFLHILAIVLAPLVLLDLAFGAVRLARALRRRSSVDALGAASFESVPAYLGRLVHAAAPPALILGMLVLCLWAIVHFGPLKPIHEWFL
jgi:hypothetical protein